MNQEYIILKGMRENNLKNISLEIPKRKITVFTGVSGSGKSSIVFDTVGKEAQRQLNENFTAFVRNFLPKFSEVKADEIKNLSAPVIIDQGKMGGNSRSTLGTTTDINSFLRALFSRFGTPHIGNANLFGFNDVSGMCSHCEGLGKTLEPNMDMILDKSKSLNEGAILLSNYKVGSWYWKIFSDSGFFDLDKKVEDYSEKELNKLLYQEPEKIKREDFGGINITYEGLIVRINRSVQSKTDGAETSKKNSNLFIEDTCRVCKGRRLNEKALEVKLNGYNIAELTEMEIKDLIKFIEKIDIVEALPLTKGILEKLNNIMEIGLGYLTLDRATTTLSGGESQRIKMVKHLNSNLVDLLYVFDEPSIGLHPRDVYRLNNLLIKLRDKGNTVIVVEHDPDVIKIADHIVDVGPFAGKKGGEIVFTGSYEDLLKSGTLTGNALNISMPIKENPRPVTDYLYAKNCNKNNLKNIDVKIPKGILTVVTGVAGSGKSTLIKDEFLKQNPEGILIDQSPVVANSRSSLATYSGIMDNIRKIFAKENEVSISLFSANSDGGCENCKGSGIVETNLAFMDAIKVTCEVCEGKKFKEEVLKYTYNQKNIVEVLDMTVSECIDFFKQKPIKSKLEAIEKMGIGYLSLGQTLDTLSGGEGQRLKLASELHKESNVYILDEPTTGLHMADIEKFVKIVEDIVDLGNTVIIIEHNTDVIKSGDYIIDLGPDGGTRGGEIVFEGLLKDLSNSGSITGKYI